jgi:hypothetical protein
MHPTHTDLLYVLIRYWKAAGCEVPDAATAKPMSIPVAVKEAGAEEPITVSAPDEEAGSAIVTVAGTVKVPALGGAVQVNRAPPPCDRVELPEIITDPFESPPLHVTVTPFDRSTLEALAALVQAIAGGAVTCPWKAPTSAPPVPLTV